MNQKKNLIKKWENRAIALHHSPFPQPYLVKQSIIRDSSNFHTLQKLKLNQSIKLPLNLTSYLSLSLQLTLIKHYPIHSHNPTRTFNHPTLPHQLHQSRPKFYGMGPIHVFQSSGQILQPNGSNLLGVAHAFTDDGNVVVNNSHDDESLATRTLRVDCQLLNGMVQT